MPVNAKTASILKRFLKPATIQETEEFSLRFFPIQEI